MAGAGEEGGVTGRIRGRASARKANASWIIDSTNRCRIGRRPRHRLRPAARARKPASRFASARLSPSESSRSPRSPIQRSRAAAARRDRGWRRRSLPSRSLRSRSRRRQPAASAAGAAAAASAARPRASRRRHRAAPRRALQPPPRGDAARQLPIILRAREVRGRPDLDAVGRGRRRVPARRHGDPAPTSSATTRPRTWRAPPATSSSRATATSSAAPSCSSRSSASKASFARRPTASRAPAPAARRALIEFIDDQRAAATDATYSSCTVEDADGEPAWILKAGELRIDHETNEGVAHDAVLRFYGVPILAAPVLSFPLSDERKSGLLPPSFGIDSRERLPGRDPVLLEHRAEPRRDLHAAG